MSEIQNVAIVGGTHGNEFTGIVLLKNWQKKQELISRPSLNCETLFANPKAYEANTRYLDSDLNRQFSLTSLADNTLTNYEQSRAKVINSQLGPKGNSRIDFIIDLHNTTSNMGPCLMLCKADDFNKKLGAYIKKSMPEANIIFDNIPGGSDQNYLSSISPQGVTIEVGPQPQSVIRQDIFESMSMMTHFLLDYLEMTNTKKLPKLPVSYEAFQYVETLELPMDNKGARIGMIHKDLQDNDFKLLKKGDAIFTLFSGEEIFYQGDYDAFPHFVNEAAYYDNNLAMSLSKKFSISI